MTTTPERAGREGDTQPLPTASTTPHMHDLVAQALTSMWSVGDATIAAIISDLKDRKALGIKRYGQPLQAHNGRNPLLDAYEETLDQCAYLRQALYEKSFTHADQSYLALNDVFEHALHALVVLRGMLDV